MPWGPELKEIRSRAVGEKLSRVRIWKHSETIYITKGDLASSRDAGRLAAIVRGQKFRLGRFQVGERGYEVVARIESRPGKKVWQGKSLRKAE